jgi:hypothetical protein
MMASVLSSMSVTFLYLLIDFPAGALQCLCRTGEGGNAFKSAYPPGPQRGAAHQNRELCLSHGA